MFPFLILLMLDPSHVPVFAVRSHKRARTVVGGQMPLVVAFFTNAPANNGLMSVHVHGKLTIDHVCDLSKEFLPDWIEQQRNWLGSDTVAFEISNVVLLPESQTLGDGCSIHFKN